MALPAALQAVVDGFGDHVASLDTTVASLKTSNDALILAANQVLDALRALQGQTTITAADLQAAIEPLQTRVDTVKASVAQIDASVDAATATLTP